MEKNNKKKPSKSEQRIKRLFTRNKKIENRFKELSSKVYSGKNIYSHEYIIEKMSDEFSLSERTIQDIVFGRVKYRGHTLSEE